MLFALGNSSDAFLILRSQSAGYSASETVMLYVALQRGLFDPFVPDGQALGPLSEPGAY